MNKPQTPQHEIIVQHRHTIYIVNDFINWMYKNGFRVNHGGTLLNDTSGLVSKLAEKYVGVDHDKLDAEQKALYLWALEQD